MGRNNRIDFYSRTTSNDEIVVTSSFALMNEKSTLFMPASPCLTAHETIQNALDIILPLLLFRLAER